MLHNMGQGQCCPTNLPIDRGAWSMTKSLPQNKQMDTPPSPQTGGNTRIYCFRQTYWLPIRFTLTVYSPKHSLRRPPSILLLLIAANTPGAFFLEDIFPASTYHSPVAINSATPPPVPSTSPRGPGPVRIYTSCLMIVAA